MPIRNINDTLNIDDSNSNKNRFDTVGDDREDEEDNEEVKECKKRLIVLRQSALVGLGYCGLV